MKLRAVEREAKVLKFLLANPFSSSTEVFSATGCGMSNVRSGLIKMRRYNGVCCFRVNRVAYKNLFT